MIRNASFLTLVWQFYSTGAHSVRSLLVLNPSYANALQCCRRLLCNGESGEEVRQNERPLCVLTFPLLLNSSSLSSPNILFNHLDCITASKRRLNLSLPELEDPNRVPPISERCPCICLSLIHVRQPTPRSLSRQEVLPSPVQEALASLLVSCADSGV